MLNDPLHDPAEANVTSILEWLALAHERTGQEEASGLQQRLLVLRETQLPVAKRLKLLDLLYGYAAKLTQAQLPTLEQISLPVSRKVRHSVRSIQDALETLTQDYLGLAPQFSTPQTAGGLRSPHNILRRAMQCLSWQVTTSYLIAAPLRGGIWQQLHGVFQSSRRLTKENITDPAEERSLEQLYSASLLFSVVQPASFTSQELQFIGEYIDKHGRGIEPCERFPTGRKGIFWIAPEGDSPPHALSRRSPPPETTILYFACDPLAQRAAKHLDALNGGKSAAELGLPAFADTDTGRGVLKRLSIFWSNPAKRKFPRRRQTYRADLCIGLEQVCQLLQAPDEPPTISKWMITNESPDGYAMMHVSGATEQLRVGAIVALRPRQDEETVAEEWQVCIVRWALSENPEHIEIGLQVLAARGVPAILARPQDSLHAGKAAALLLPKAPPLRHSQALVVAAGTVTEASDKLVVLVEQDNVAVHELRTTHLDELTSSIQVFTVEPDETP